MAKMTREAFIRLIKEDLEWLRANAPESPERHHIELILFDAPNHYYPPQIGEAPSVESNRTEVD